MGLFDRFKKQALVINYEEVTSEELAENLARQGVLRPLYLMPLRFGGEESPFNRVFVPKEVIFKKNDFDDRVEKLLVEGKVKGYDCTPEYKGESFIPSSVTIVASMDGEPVISETIEIW